MEIDSLQQLHILLRSVLLGWSLGLLYDLLRALRRRCRQPWLRSTLDALYGLMLFLLVFLFTLRVGGGELRVFLLAGLAIGLLLFFALCSALLRPVWDLWVDTVLRFLRLLILPFRLLLRQLKIFLHRLKKFFHFFRRCYIILFCKQGGLRPIRRKGRSHGRS